MKQNKKAILGFVTAMIFSLGILQGITQKNKQQQDINLQQATIGCLYMANATEGGPAMATLWDTIGITMGAETAAMTGVCLAAGPIGWGVLGVYTL